MRDRRLLLGLLAVLVAGCGTPAARIRRNPALFASFQPAVQGKVRQGEVAVGFTRDMVRMALGEPNRGYQCETAKGATEVWSYTAAEFTTNRQMMDTLAPVTDSAGRLRLVPDWTWVDVQQRNEYEYLRVEFTGDKATAVERMKR